MAKTRAEEATKVKKKGDKAGEAGKKRKFEEKKPKRCHVKITVEAPDGRLAEITRGVMKPLKDEGADVTVVERRRRRRDQ